MKAIRIISLIAIALAIAGTTFAADQRDADVEIGINERLGDYIPMDLGFVTASGDSVYMRDIIERPTVIALVYFSCPTICKPLLNGVADVVARTGLDPGVDYDVITISFDEFDTPEKASEMRETFAEPIAKVEGDDWRFLTADSTTIASFTHSVGFGFQRREHDFAHASALIVLAPDGKIVRYIYGLTYLPFDLKMAVAEADAGKVGPTIAKVLQYCFSYDPSGRRYVFNMTRVGGAGILLLAFGWVVYISTIGRAKGNRKARNG